MLLILAFCGRDPYVCVAIMTISLGFNGAASSSNLANSQDLAPNFAGTMYGIINCFGTTPGFFSPLIVAAFTSESVNCIIISYIIFHIYKFIFLSILLEHYRRLVLGIRDWSRRLHCARHNFLDLRFGSDSKMERGGNLRAIR